MEDRLKEISEEFEKDILKINSEDDVFEIEKKFLGRKSGKLTELFKLLPFLSEDLRKNLGPKINLLKRKVEETLYSIQRNLKKESFEFDEKTPPIVSNFGTLHPLTKVKEIFIEIFLSMGFDVLEGPEVESVWYNFDALNVPKDHPARDAQDTFFLTDGNILRTHTSNMQVRYYETHKPPFQAIILGKTFRNEATDASHEHTFYQIEGFAVGENINASNLKHTLSVALSKAFNKKIDTRFRPSFFPFVEPGYEVDFSCAFCDGRGCRICKNTGWIEWLGAGMIHPNVLRAGKIDPERYQGWAFGGGLERFAMIRFGIEEIRNFHSGDLRFLKQEI